MGQFDETVDETGVNLTPTPGLDPFSAMVTPAMLGSGPQAPPMPPVQMPTPPQAPAPPGNMQRIISMALLGLAAGLGPRHAGGGVAQGLMQGQQSNDQERKLQFQQQQLQYQQQQQEAIRQQKLQDEQQKLEEARMAKRQQMLMSVAKTVPTLTTKAKYDQFMDMAGNVFTQSGYRDLSPTMLRHQFRFSPPELKEQATAALDKFQNNKLVQEQIKNTGVESVLGSQLMIGQDRDGNDIPSMTARDIMKLTGMELKVDGETSVPLEKMTEFDAALVAAKQEFVTEHGGMRPKAADSPDIYKRARAMMQNKDPEMANLTKELAKQRLENAKKPKDESLMSITETDPETQEQVTSLVPRKAGEVSRKPPKEPNQAQFQAGAYAGRMEQSGQILDQLEKDVSGMNVASFAVQSRLPSAAQSGTYQSYGQAARNFVNALLRRESGAAISQSEFDNARKQYIPQPGDTPQTLKQKKANRDYVFQTMKAAAGPRGYQPPITVDPATSAREKLKNR